MDEQTTTLLVQYVSAHDLYNASRDQIVEVGGRAARALRKDARRTLRKFAADLDVTPSCLSKIENGHMPLGADLAKKMLEAVR